MFEFPETLTNEDRYTAQLSLIVDPLNSGIRNLPAVVDSILETSKLHRAVASALLQHINTNDELPLLRTTLARRKDRVLALITGLSQEIVTAIKAAGGRRSRAGRSACVSTLSRAGDIFFEIEANAADHPGVEVPDFLRSRVFDKATGRHQWVVMTVTRFVHAVTEAIPTVADPVEVAARMDRIGRLLGRALRDVSEFLMRCRSQMERRRERRAAARIKGVESDEGSLSPLRPLYT